MIAIKTKGNNDVINITKEVEEVVEVEEVKDGICFLFVGHSTCGLTTIEFEPGVVQDLKDAFERLIPRDIEYKHDEKWGDGNGFSHVRASFLKPSLSIPIEKGKLMLGTWQQIILVDFDNRPRTRKIIVKMVEVK